MSKETLKRLVELLVRAKSTFLNPHHYSLKEQEDYVRKDTQAIIDEGFVYAEDGDLINLFKSWLKTETGKKHLKDAGFIHKDDIKVVIDEEKLHREVFPCWREWCEKEGIENEYPTFRPRFRGFLAKKIASSKDIARIEVKE